MNLTYILENEKLCKLMNDSIGKTFYKYKLYFLIEKEDFEQEVYLYLHNNISKFDSEKASLNTYIPLLVMTVATKVIKEQNGQSKKSSKLDFKNSQTSYEEMEEYSYVRDKSDIDLEIENNMVINEIMQLKSVSEKQKQIISLMKEGYTVSEIAKMLNYTKRYIYKEFSNAKEKIVRYYI